MNKTKQGELKLLVSCLHNHFSQLITVNLQYSGIEKLKRYSDVNCVKTVCI